VPRGKGGILTASPPALVGSSSDLLGAATVVVSLVLLVLLFEKAVAVNVSAPGFHRLSRCLDVGVVPLGSGWIIVAALALGRLLAGGS
jgi:hypothetical protein